MHWLLVSNYKPESRCHPIHISVPLINELSVLPVWCLLELPLASHNCEQDKQMY